MGAGCFSLITSETPVGSLFMLSFFCHQREPLLLFLDVGCDAALPLVGGDLGHGPVGAVLLLLYHERLELPGLSGGHDEGHDQIIN